LFVLGAKKRVAVVDKSWHSKLINAPVFLPNAATTHQAIRTLKMVAPHLESIPDYCLPKLKLPAAIEEKYQSTFMNKTSILLLSATTTKLASRLCPKRYAAIASTIANRYMLSIAIVAMSGDRKRAESIAEELSAPHQLHFPRNFDEFMVLLGKADLYFVGDGGVSHIGSGFGKRGVVLFGEATSDVWGPMSAKFQCLSHPVDVNQLTDNEIMDALSQQCEEVLSERVHL
jgi:ADP-heptose:LPS heptosyltransferase